MDYKVTLTKMFLDQLGMSSDDKNIKKFLSVFWQNPRKKVNAGLRLTDAGFTALTEKLNIKNYPIRFPKETEWTSQLVVRLDKYIDCPYYISKHIMYVFSEKMAVQLVLFSGDITKFGRSKHRITANKTTNSVDKII